MTDETSEPKRSLALGLALPLLLAAAIGFGAGCWITERTSQSTLALVIATAKAERQREREIATQREIAQNAIIEKQRKESHETIRKRDDHFAAFAATSVGLRQHLEALLEASRRAGDACTGRLAEVASDLAQLDELLGQSVELLKGGRDEIAKLESENRRLAAQVIGWQEYDRSRHPQTITVTGKHP